MENFKKWEVINQLNYSFTVNDKMIGSMQIDYSNWERKAIFKIEKETFTLKYNGFWKSNFEISDEKGMVVLKSFSEKWFANSTILEYKTKKLKLKVRNNPLAEYVIFDGEKEVIAYGLDTKNGKAIVRINSDSNSDYLLDCLLWYIFLPIAMENMGDNFVFHTLLMTQ